MTKTLQIFNILCLQRVFVIARLAREYVKNLLFADGKPKQTRNSLRVNACKVLRCIEILRYKSATQPKLNSKKDAKYIKINNSKLRIELLSIGCYLLSSPFRGTGGWFNPTAHSIAPEVYSAHQ